MPEETKEPSLASVDNSAPASVTAASASETKASPEKPAASADVTKRVPEAATPLTGEQPAEAASKAVAPAAVKPVAPAAAKPAAAVPPKPPAPKPEPWDSELVRSLKAQYGSGIREASTYAGQNYLAVDSSITYETLLRLRDDEFFDYCVDITAVHYPKRDVQFDVVYVLYSFHSNERLRIKTQLKDGEPLRSAVAIWPTANWLEREVFDMFGIEFNGHPELKRILMPEDWKGHPLRKDYAILQQDTEWVKNNIGIESAQ
jgi:NADH-quinone oxidoreductase subunit C